MFKKIVFAAAAAGLLAGLIVSAIQSVGAIPLILKAETYENAGPQRQKGAAAPQVQEAASIDVSRTGLTALSNVITAIGFAFVLIAGFAVKGGIDWRNGILWGLGGFAAFSLAPSLGLLPELPGTFAAPLPDRQIWWVATVAMTVGGLALGAFAPGWGWKMLGAVLIAAPHLIPAPHPARLGGLAPEALMNQFVAVSLITSALFWSVLGGLSGYFFHRFENA